MAANGIAQRASSAYVTDAGGETYSLGEAYPITRAGETFGWSVDSTGNARDRDTLRPKTAGIVFHVNGSGTRYFRWDKPAGTYTVRVAIGDSSNNQIHKLVIRDGVGGSVLATITGSTGVAEWLDATGVLRAGYDGITQSIWERDNVALSLTNASGAFVFEIGDAAGGSAATTLAYVSVVAAAAPPTATLSGSLDTITGNLTVGAGAISATLNGTLDSITGNTSVGGSTGRLTSQLPLRDAARLVLANRSDVCVSVQAKPGLAPVALFAAQSITSGIWTAAGPFTPGSRYNVLYEVGGEPIGCEIITATAP